MAESRSRGRFVWYDLMTTDPKGAEVFYARVAGWQTQTWEPANYTMWTANGQPIGGVIALPPGGLPPHWLAHITVPDVESAVREAERLGGSVLTPARDIPTVGRYAILGDPQGAAFAVFAPLNDMPGDGEPPKVGEFSWHELAAADHRKAFGFYEALFGWEKSAEHDMGALGTYLVFGRKGQNLGGMFALAPGMAMLPNWMQYIRVESADAAAQRVAAHGGKVLNGPMDVPGGDRIAQCLDAQGAPFAVHEVSK